LYSNRSAANANEGRFYESVADADKVIELQPSWAKGYSRKGLALFFLRNFDAALEAYREGLKLEPENEVLKNGYEQVMNKIRAMDLNEKGEEALAKNKFREAVEFLNKAVELEPSDYLLRANRSEANLKAGYLDAALEDADMTMRLRPEWIKGYIRRADALFYLGRYDEAASTCALALQTDPSNERLKKLMNSCVQEVVVRRTREEMEKKENEKKKEDKDVAKESPSKKAKKRKEHH